MWPFGRELFREIYMMIYGMPGIRAHSKSCSSPSSSSDWLKLCRIEWLLLLLFRDGWSFLACLSYTGSTSLWLPRNLRNTMLRFCLISMKFLFYCSSSVSGVIVPTLFHLMMVLPLLAIF